MERSASRGSSYRECEHLDHVNAFIAGKEKSRLAAAVALKVAKDDSLHCQIELRNDKRTIFTEGAHKHLCVKHPNDDGTEVGNALYNLGDKDFSRPLRALAREARARVDGEGSAA